MVIARFFMGMSGHGRSEGHQNDDQNCCGHGSGRLVSGHFGKNSKI